MSVETTQFEEEQSIAELSLPEQLARIRMELDIMYAEFTFSFLGERYDPYYYVNLNTRSQELAQKHKEYCSLQSQLIGCIAINS
jgi:hypothetical protein